jgi:serine/threonine protein phosphatase 1
MAKVDFNPRQDQLFSTGNLIDYGNDSLRVLSLLPRDWFFAVVGIHELYLLDALKRDHYLGWYTQGEDWAFDKKLRINVDLAQASEYLTRLPIAYRIEQKKHGDIGVISGLPLQPFSPEGFQQASLNALYRCIQSGISPDQKAAIYQPLSCIVCGGPAAQKLWAKGNAVAINQGARYLPVKGKLQLNKVKKLLKIVHKQTAYQPLI